MGIVFLRRLLRGRDDRRRARRSRRRLHRVVAVCVAGTVMSHGPHPGAPSAFAITMIGPSFLRRAVPLRGSPARRALADETTERRAVPMPTVACAAEDEESAAMGTAPLTKRIS